MGRWYPTRNDLNSPQALERAMRRLVDIIYNEMPQARSQSPDGSGAGSEPSERDKEDIILQQITQVNTVASADLEKSLPLVRDALEAGGSHQLSLIDLLGRTATPQPASAEYRAQYPQVTTGVDGQLEWYNNKLIRLRQPIIAPTSTSGNRSHRKKSRV